MHGVKDSPQLRSLTGSLLQQICFGENEVILRFDEGISINISVDIAIRSNNYRPAPGVFISSYLVGLLGKKISRVNILGSDTLELIFDGAESIRLTDESEHYESVIITLPTSTLVI